MERDLRGRTLVVTGAAGGLGTAVAMRLAARGCDVVLCDVAPAPLAALAERLAAAGARVARVVGDVADESTALAAGEACDRLGGAPVLFSNAGIDPLDARSVVETDPDVWDRVLAVNLRAGYLLSRALIPRMVAAGGGSIVYTASTAAMRGEPAEAAYVVSKTALLGLARSVTRDFASAGVRANCLCPGPLEQVMGDRRAKMTEQELRHRSTRFVDVIPAGREGGYEEVASTAAFLLGPESSYVAGTAVVVDGGLLA